MISKGLQNGRWLCGQESVGAFSGGQDSTTCLAWALKNCKEVETVGFDYGQRHTAEITCRKHILETIEDVLPYAKGRLGQDHMIDMKVLGQISECSLTREIEIEFEKDGVPNSFVPARNLLFSRLHLPLHIAAAALFSWAACVKPTTRATPTAETTH